MRCLIGRKCATCGTRTSHAYLRSDEHRDTLEERLDPLAEVRRLREVLAAQDGVEVFDNSETRAGKPSRLFLVWYPVEHAVEVQFNFHHSADPTMATALREAVEIVTAGVDNDHSRRWKVDANTDGGVMLYLAWVIG